MVNNVVLRRVGYAFKLSLSEIGTIFLLGGVKITPEQLMVWMKREDDEGFENMLDESLVAFLNGFIIYNRGKKEGEAPVLEKKINNNLVFRKLRIALNLKDQDIIEILESVDFKLSKSELSALFRNSTHSNYRECKDQLLRNFLNGLAVKYRVE